MTEIVLVLVLLALIVVGQLHGLAMPLFVVVCGALAVATRVVLNRNANSPINREKRGDARTRRHLCGSIVEFRVQSFLIELDHRYDGLEIYSVEGQEVLRLRSFALTGIRDLPLPSGETLRIQVHSLTHISASIGPDLVRENVLAGTFQQSLATALPIAIALGAIIGLLRALFEDST